MKFSWDTFPKKEDFTRATKPEDRLPEGEVFMFGAYYDAVAEWVVNHKAELRERQKHSFFEHPCIKIEELLGE
jgi:hypothetical protein